MKIAETVLPEFDFEMALTRKILERTDWGKKDWKPHDKSMSFGRLAAHIAESTTWCISTFTKTEVDMKKTPYQPLEFASLEDLLKTFDKSVPEARACIASTSDENFMQTWTLRDGENIFFSMPRIAVYRSFVIKHMVHHRGQFSVFLRLNNISVPSIYGPSADEIN